MRTLTIVTLGLLAAVAVPARAGIVTELVDVTSTPEGYLWTYSVSISGGVFMGSLGSVPGAGTLPRDTDLHLDEETCPCPEIKDYLTIYDFGGFLGVVQFSEPGLDWRSYAFGSTPADAVAVVDDTAVANVTIFQSRPRNVDPFGGFSFGVLSSVGGPPQVASYAGELTDPGTQLGQTSFGVTQGPAQVPEPASVWLLAGGLLAMARFARQDAR